jgi:hypothetical protein
MHNHYDMICQASFKKLQEEFRTLRFLNFYPSEIVTYPFLQHNMEFPVLTVTHKRLNQF